MRKIKTAAILIILGFFIQGCASVSTLRGYKIREYASLQKLCSQYGIDYNFRIFYEDIKLKHKYFNAYLKIDSDYNTYIHTGLPPGPICNPGLVALKASFNPEKTDYLYFLLKDREKGEHFFSKRLSEHNRARILYLKKQD